MKKKILVVEDDNSLRLLYEEELGEEGYDVITARNGKEALSRSRADKPDLIILDIIMPDMDGISAIARILEEDRKPRIIVHTAYPEYRENFMTWGADAYIMKSLDLKELKEKVRELLEQINPL